MIKITFDNGEEYTEEQYKKDYVRMMDSLRQDYLGAKNCLGVDCGNCPLLKKTCGYKGNESSYYRSLETVKIVHNWAKAHHIVTNEDMLKKTFGNEVLVYIEEEAYRYGWMSKEYKEPKGEKR